MPFQIGDKVKILPTVRIRCVPDEIGDILEVKSISPETEACWTRNISRPNGDQNGVYYVEEIGLVESLVVEQEKVKTSVSVLHDEDSPIPFL